MVKTGITDCLYIYIQKTRRQMKIIKLYWVLNNIFFFFFLAALLFGGKNNPAHPKHIGSIDPSCNVVEVIRGKVSRQEQES